MIAVELAAEETPLVEWALQSRWEKAKAAFGKTCRCFGGRVCRSAPNVSQPPEDRARRPRARPPIQMFNSKPANTFRRRHWSKHTGRLKYPRPRGTRHGGCS